MADLNKILYSYVNGITPVVKRDDGLYTLVLGGGVNPDIVLGTNLRIYFQKSSLEIVPAIVNGTWDTDSFRYDNNTNHWYYNEQYK